MSYSLTQQNFNNNIYSQFTSKIPGNLKEILNHTKKLIVNSRNYNKYSKNYLKSTQINSFKTPDNGNYPLIKNRQLIPLNKSIYHFYVNNKTNENEEKKNDENKISIKHVRYKSENLFSNSSRKKINFKKIIKNCNKNIEQEKIFILRDIFFYDENYNYLVYDESLIFYKYHYYQDYIINVIKKFKKEKNENLTTFLIKNYENNSNVDLNNNNNDIYNKTSILLKSMKIEFTNLSDSSKKNINFQIPFSYLPLFAFDNFKYLKEFLIAIFKFNKTFDEISFEEGELINFLNNFDKFETLQKTTTKNDENNFLKRNLNLNEFNNLNDQKLNYKKSTTTHIEFLKKIKTVTETPHLTFKRNSLLNLNKEKKNNILYEKNNNNNNKIKSMFHFYHYFWMTPEYKYKVTIKLPEIQINLNNLIVNKFIDTELMLFLIKKNFINWDFYVVHYLFSFRNFRFIIEKILSKSLKNIESVYNIDKNGYINFQKVKDVLYCNLTKEKNNNQSENYFHFSFFYTESNLKNYIKTLNSFSCKIFNEYINPEKIFDFQFNFKQMKILNKISKNQNLIGFFNKLIITNRHSMQIDLNYEFFDNFEHYDYFFLPDIEHKNSKQGISRKYSRKKSFTRSLSRQSINSLLNITGDIKKDNNNNINIYKEKINKNKNDINNFIIKIREPYFNIIEYDSENFTGNCIKKIHNENDNSFDDLDESSIVHGIKIDILNKICKEKDISEWPNILINEINTKKMRNEENIKHSKKSSVRFSTTVKRISNFSNGGKNNFTRKNSNLKKNSTIMNIKINNK